MALLVTAFGPFDGRPVNASSQALAGLKRARPALHTRVLAVDAVTGPSRLRRALRDLQPDAVLLLGEAAGSTAIRLETTAWNELDFRIPDAAGRQPRAQAIDPASPASLASTLPIATLHTHLTAAGHPVELSNDPGRYLCNQVMFVALRHLAATRPGTPAGFVHLPLATTYPTDRVVDALVRITDLLGDPHRSHPTRNLPQPSGFSGLGMAGPLVE